MKEFKNKVAAITGSATGIGRAFAEEAAKRGIRLALIDINTEGLEETKAICEKAGAPKVVTIKTDVTKYEEVRFSILRVMQEYGQLDLMFANAGIATAGWVYNHPPQDWAWAMNTNVLGLTYYVHEVLPIFKQQGTPCHFLFTASIAGLITGLRYNTAYLASKHAAVCIAEAVRDQWPGNPRLLMIAAEPESDTYTENLAMDLATALVKADLPVGELRVLQRETADVAAQLVAGADVIVLADGEGEDADAQREAFFGELAMSTLLEGVKEGALVIALSEAAREAIR